ncbi:hypothetical protein AB9X41_23605 [Ralstonia solanacearum]|uniref:hypothetical protein n=1 Tax=Ralstonia solanacearum TaxID=305 RepID=UPI0035135A41
MSLRTLHSIVHVQILEGALGTSLPLLFLRDGEVSFLALAWVRQKSLVEGLSSSTIAKAVAAIGRFYDFYELEKSGRALATGELRLLLIQFYEARRFGLKSLAWDAVKVTTAAADVRVVSDFTDWCADNFGHAYINPLERVMIQSLNLREQRAARFKLSFRKNWDVLYHLTPATQAAAGVVSRRPFDPMRGKRQRSFSDNKHFPADKVWETICKTPLVRDKLYLLLLFFGGLRMSEPLHLFASDVSVLPDGMARVVMGHPQDGSYQWIASDKKKRSGHRATFLKERYGLGARNVLPESHPLHAGWKGMMADDGKRSESVVHWLREDAGRLFAQLHSEYVKTFRGRLTDSHPYYFANVKVGESYGRPLTLSNATKLFNRAARRVGLSTEQPGVNPHGGRHFYGFYCASILRLPIETTQRLMHHQSAISTQDYYALSAKAVRDELVAAQERRALETPPMLAAPLLSPDQSAKAYA